MITDLFNDTGLHGFDSNFPLQAVDVSLIFSKS
jgi:hypothetical protein